MIFLSPVLNTPRPDGHHPSPSLRTTGPSQPERCRRTRNCSGQTKPRSGRGGQPARGRFPEREQVRWPTSNCIVPAQEGIYAGPALISSREGWRNAPGCGGLERDFVFLFRSQVSAFRFLLPLTPATRWPGRGKAPCSPRRSPWSERCSRPSPGRSRVFSR